MRTLRSEPLTSAAFAPFGEVLEAPGQPGRAFFDASLGDGRTSARPSLSIARCLPVLAPMLQVTQLERHAFSSQSFMPMAGGRWLVIVCPHGADGEPDAAAARAFAARPDQGVTYRRDTWHHGLTVLDRPACHAIFMWRDGGAGDEEFRPVEPFRVELPPPSDSTPTP